MKVYYDGCSHVIDASPEVLMFGKLTEAQAKLLIEIGQCCIDWVIDTEDCHLCERDNRGEHDEDCPVGDYLRDFPSYTYQPVCRP